MKNRSKLYDSMTVWAFLIVIAVLVLGAFNFATGAGHSMEPTMSNTNITIGYNWATDYKTGDIISFTPKSWNTAPRYTKRIVAAAGDIVIVDGINTYINGILFDSSVLAPGYPYQKYVLKSDEFFVVGDNRSFSLDSRAKGPINRTDIISKVIFWINY